MTGRRAALTAAAVPPPFGSWLTAIMHAYGYSSDQALAEELGVSDPTVGRWRKDTSVPAIPQLRQLAKHFRTPLADLVILAGHLTPDELPGAELPRIDETRLPLRMAQNALNAIEEILASYREMP